MSEKPRSQPSEAKPSAKPAGKGPPSKPKPPEESFDFLAPPQGPGELGRLAHYRVVKVLGRGGMGIVFQAEDTRLHRIVGLKVMLPKMAKKQVAHDRFIREARATAAIEHDHIVTIYEVNEDHGIPYLAMQCLKGATLDEYLKRGKTLDVPKIMRIGKEIAKGLAAAHKCGLIHRDVKPSNIWLDSTNRGRVKLLDFGLARPTNAETHLTQEGMVLGSPAYMAPEQAFGHNVDERCDLFSLGCVLFWLCAGRLPFTGKDPMSMLQAITSAEPTPLRELNGEVPQALAELVHQMLAKKPENRPPSAQAVVERIKEIERDWIARSNTLEMPRVGGSGKPRNLEATVIRAEDYDVEPVLEESAIMDLEPPSSDSAEARAPGRSWLVAGLGGALIAILSVFCCLGIWISTDHGFVQVVAEDDDAQAYLDKTGLSVLDHHKNARNLKGGTHQLQTGGYQVETGDLPEGFHVEPAIFALVRRETLELKVRYVSPKPVRPKLVAFKSEEAKKIQQEWATYLDRPIVDPLLGDLKVVLIPPGAFEMGTAKEIIDARMAELNKKNKGKLPPQLDALIKSESPRHTVRITRPFYLGECEVTVGQFGQFVVSEQYRTIPETSKKGGTGFEKGVFADRKSVFSWKNTGFKQSPDHPVCNITWKDAEAYCDWLSKRTRRTCRLPTEAEWEYACRAGTTTLWSHTDDLKEDKHADHMRFQSANKLSAYATTHTVGKKKANPFGLFDMHGNVEEMCKDYWATGYYDGSPPEDPPGPEGGGKNPQRVARGGSFQEVPFLCRSATRNPLDPALGYVQVGFRVLCEIPLLAD